MAAVPLGPFVRYVIMGAVGVYENWDTISGVFDRHVESPTTPIFGQYVQHIFEMKDSSGAFATRERGLTGTHWINTTGGDLDTTWTSADYALVETGFQNYWTSLALYVGNEVRLVEHRWYPFGPGVHPPSAPSRVTTLGSPIAGSSGVGSPHQVAVNLTFRTPLRRHWGRMCLPYFGGSFAAGGVLSSATVDAYANGGSTYIKSGNANGLSPVIWDRVRGSALGVTAVECDSIPDIQRRRRSRTTSYRKVLTA